MKKTTRRQFFQRSLAGTSLLLLPKFNLRHQQPTTFAPPTVRFDTYGIPLDLAPAQWIWLPAGRTLPNSFVFFRKPVRLSEKPVKATGWILGESRYKLHVNGERIQWGPAPFDPRWAEADPLDLTGKLQTGDNLIGVEVLYYGFGDGTMPIGKPGFIFKLDVEYAGGRKESIVSDESWQGKIAQAWKPGQYKRWYLRSLQEEFDARLYPTGWNTVNYTPSASEPWLAAAVIAGSSPKKPVLASWSRDYLYDSGGGNLTNAELRTRSVAMVGESLVPVKQLSEQAWVQWNVPADEFFQFDLPENKCFQVIREPVASQTSANAWTFQAEENRAAALTFEFEIQSVGFPYFTIEASEGTIVELLVHEAHQVNGTHALLNTHFHSWTKFICKEGKNRFEVFDYESLRWLQLHIRNARGTVRISEVGMRRRAYPFPQTPQFQCSDKKLEKLFSACVNTVYNNSQETIVDGMARERQQYSGDLGHMVHAIFRGFGEVPMLARFCNTYSQGMTKAGFFLDTWPAYDRLARLMEREIGITDWGPLLDHGVGFNFDCYHYYLYTGDIAALKEVYPRLKTFFRYLHSLLQTEGTLPVENIGIPTVWIDHVAYKQQRHKTCAFNLYVAAMCKNALSVLAKAFADEAFGDEVFAFGVKIHEATVRRFFSAEQQVFVCNLPWRKEEGEIRHCDRSLATAVMFDMNPLPNAADAMAAHQNSLKMLAERPASLGISYPTNAVWRYWALAKGNRIDVLLREFRDYWFHAPSVQLNHVLAEFLEVQPDTTQQWSHASIAPMIHLYMDIAGIRPLKAGFAEVEIVPQLSDLEAFSLTHQTIHGGIELNLKQRKGRLEARIFLPDGIRGHLVWNGKKTALKTGWQQVKV